MLMNFLLNVQNNVIDFRKWTNIISKDRFITFRDVTTR